MLEVRERAIENEDQPVTAELVLNYDQRQKCRMRVQSSCGQDVGIILERGESLHDGDVLRASDGTLLRVVAAPENLSEVVCANAWMLMRVAYHLGNRHVPLQILPGVLRYQRDYVLDDMVRQLGLHVDHVLKGFQPEKGAYHAGGHTHGHDGHGPHGQRGNIWRMSEIVL